ncbi:hypothetical protein jhhlp_008299 [Lomentospora prolificans]|uniref:F-box domain-containing protein n=1 Tax=Lomentospora prolificans TaxID=41688 RepID=A0A2N3MXM9_9PEZI|nr:hypothetical protein jhhlp_008299 [Lomentospora prolificans]
MGRWVYSALKCSYMNNGSTRDAAQHRFGSLIGEENLVCDPMGIDEVSAYLEKALQEDRFRQGATSGPERRVSKLAKMQHSFRSFRKSRSGSLGTGSKVKQDVLSKMPFEIMLKICENLTIDDIARVVSASPRLYRQMRHSNEFWEIAIASKMPWFFELQELIKDDNFIWDKDLYAIMLWALKISWGAPRMSLLGPKSLWERPHAILANRRRIWHVCDEILPRYLEDLPTGYIPPVYRSH